MRKIVMYKNKKGEAVNEERANVKRTRIVF